MGMQVDSPSQGQGSIGRGVSMRREVRGVAAPQQAQPGRRASTGAWVRRGGVFQQQPQGPWAAPPQMPGPAGGACFSTTTPRAVGRASADARTGGGACFNNNPKGRGPRLRRCQDRRPGRVSAVGIGVVGPQGNMVGRASAGGVDTVARRAFAVAGAARRTGAPLIRRPSCLQLAGPI